MASYSDAPSTQPPLVQRGATLTLTDESGTNDWTLEIGPGNIQITSGGYAIVRGTDANGDLVGPPRRGAQAGVSTIAISGLVRRPGGHATAVGIVDYANENFPGAAGWDSTLTETELTTATLTLDLPTIGTSKGATWVWADVLVQPGWSVTNGADGYTISMTFESPDVSPLITAKV